MKFSTLTEIPSTKSTIDQFGGYNHNVRISDNEFYDMDNLTSTYYPALAPRPARGILQLDTFSHVSGETVALQGMISITHNDVQPNLCYVLSKTSGSTTTTKLYYDLTDDEGTDMGLTNGQKQLIQFGRYILVFPDKKWYLPSDTAGGSPTWGSMENSYNNTNGANYYTATYTLTDAEGTDYVYTASATKPVSPTNGQYWLDTSVTPNSLKVWSSSASMWNSVATTYVKIKCAGIGNGFSQYDGVTITGLSYLTELNGQTSLLQGAYHDANDNTNDYIIVTGILDTTTTPKTQSTRFDVKRRVPIMDYVCESNNRIWGCRYGNNNDGVFVNEIYACKLGDFKNWYCYQGLSTDSYAVSVGSDSPFTGACSYQTYPTFFKEHIIHRIYGNYPAKYQIQNTECRGVLKGAYKTLCVVNDVVYYLSSEGVMAYDGSLPVSISYNLGNDRYYYATSNDQSAVSISSYTASPIGDTVGGTCGKKYFIRMLKNPSRTSIQALDSAIYVYDIANKLWHIEEDPGVRFMSQIGSRICFGTDNGILTNVKSNILETELPYEQTVNWFSESGNIGMDMANNKYILTMNVRMQLEYGAKIYFYIEYDDSGEWEYLSNAAATKTKSILTVLRPKRCDHFKIRMEGYGTFKIFSVTKKIVEGSDIS